MWGCVRAFLKRLNRRTAAPPPRVSVIIPVYNTADYLEACLDSVLTQSLDALELIAVDDGSTDASWEILNRYAEADPRVRIFRQANAGQGPARNVGVDHAIGDYITFVDSDDVIPAHALRWQVENLDRTGSDFSLGGVRLTGGSRSEPWWGPIVHGQRREAIGIDDFPDAMLDVIACNRMFRRSFWVERVGGFEGGAAYEDHVPMVVAYVRARSFDVLRRPTYVWQIRPSGDSTSQRKDELQNLRDRIAVKEQAHAILQREGSGPARSAWLARVLDADLSLFIHAALRGDDAYRAVLQAALATYVEAATPEVWQRVRVHQKLRSWLAAAGDWDAVEAVEAYFREWTQVPPTQVLDGRLVLVEDFREVIGHPVPVRLRDLSTFQSTLQIDICKVRPLDGRLEISGVARVDNLDLATCEHSLRLVLRDSAGGQIPVSLMPATDEAVLGHARRKSTPHADYTPGAFSATLDLRALTGTPGDWRLDFTLVAGTLERSGPAREHAAGSSATPAALHSVRLDGFEITPRWDGAGGFTLRVAPVTDGAASATPVGPRDAEATALRFDGDDVEWEVQLDDASGPTAAGIVLYDADSTIPLEVTEIAPTLLRVRQRPTVGGADSPVIASGWRRLGVVKGDNRPIPVRWSDALADRLQIEHGNAVHRLRFHRDASRAVVLRHGVPLADDERGPYAQQALRAWYQRLDLELDDTILCHAATIPGVELLRALVAERNGRDVWWAVADHAADRPSGSGAVLVNSRAWYRALATARELYVAADLPGYFRKRPGQEVTRVFVTPPDTSEPIGKALWAERGHTPARIRERLAQANDDWDAVVTADEATAARVRDEFDYTGEIRIGGT